MAVTIEELIAKRDEIKAKRQNLYELETSIGVVVARIPDNKLVADSWNMTDSMEGNKFIILNSVISPNLKDRELQKSFNCVEPIDIVPALFDAGEVSRIAGALLNLAGYKGEKIVPKLYKEVKNS